MSLTQGLAVDDGTLYEMPEFIAGPAARNLNAAMLTVDENQLQYHYTLQPGLNTTMNCRTGWESED